MNGRFPEADRPLDTHGTPDPLGLREWFAVSGGIIDMYSLNKSFCRSKLTLSRLIQCAALALVVTMALPAVAGEERAVKSKVSAIYPTLARRMKIEGVVVVEATVEASGQVSAAKMVSGNLILAPAAEDAVHKWTFEPGPGVTKVIVDVKFTLGE
jgi:TonB family protein